VNSVSRCQVASLVSPKVLTGRARPSWPRLR